MTELEDMASVLEELVSPSATLGVNGPHDTYLAYFTHGEPNNERREIHQEVLGVYFAQYANSGYGTAAVLMAGLPGSGKTRLRLVLSKEDIYMANAFVIDVDAIRSILIQESMKTQPLPPVGLEITPLGYSSMFHNEAKWLSRQVMEKAIDSYHPNLIIDATMKDIDRTRSQITNLRERGYTKIVGVLSEAPLDLAQRNCLRRWESGVYDYLNSKRGLGGRFIPSSNFTTHLGATGNITNVNPQRLVQQGPPQGLDEFYHYVLKSDPVAALHHELVDRISHDATMENSSPTRD